MQKSVKRKKESKMKLLENKGIFKRPSFLYF